MGGCISAATAPGVDGGRQGQRRPAAASPGSGRRFAGGAAAAAARPCITGGSGAALWAPGRAAGATARTRRGAQG